LTVSGVHDLALFVVAGLVLNLTPGPDMAYIAARGASGGFRDGAAAVLGITAGCFVHTLAAAAGLSALLATSATAFEFVKWCGALYLLYAGIRLLRTAARSHAAERREHVGDSRFAQRSPGAAGALRIFREAVLINVFNPKVALFFLAFVPQFIDRDAPAKALAFVLLGALFNFNSLFVNLPVAWLASRAARRWRDGASVTRLLRGVTGALFVLLAARLAVMSRN
jgi:threonine/homoserine/homoserine lactone efflux protein